MKMISHALSFRRISACGCFVINRCCNRLIDHFCKLKENSPQIYADFVTQMDADKTKGFSEDQLVKQFNKVTGKRMARKDTSLVPTDLNADKR